MAENDISTALDRLIERDYPHVSKGSSLAPDAPRALPMGFQLDQPTAPVPVPVSKPRPVTGRDTPLAVDVTEQASPAPGGLPEGFVLDEDPSPAVPVPTAKPVEKGLLGDFGRLTPPEQIAAAEANKAAALNQAAKATARSEKLAKLRDLDLGINPEIEAVADLQRQEQLEAPIEKSGTPEAGIARAGKKVMAATDQLEGRAKLPSQTTTRNAIDVMARTFATTGTDLVKATGIVGGMVPGIDEENAVTKAADEAEAALHEAFPGDYTKADTFVSTLASGTGSMAGFMLGNVVASTTAKAFGMSGRVAGLIGSAGTGAAVQGTQGYEEAKKAGAGALGRYTAFLLNAGLGTTEAVPIDRFFGRLNASTGGRVARILQDTKAQSLEEFTQEVVQSLGSDVIAKAVYDPDREIDAEGAVMSGVVGAILGGAMGAGAGATRSLETDEGPVPEAPEGPEPAPNAEGAGPTPPPVPTAKPSQPEPAAQEQEPVPVDEELTEPETPSQDDYRASPETVTQRATLRQYGFADSDIDEMSAEERSYEMDAARELGVEVTPQDIESATEYEAGLEDKARGDGSAQNPVRVESPADLARAARFSNTEPTEGQKEAGNYRKVHIKFHGMDMAIENPKGSTRSGRDEDGNEWSNELPAHYGYVKRTNGADGDQVDVYIGDHPSPDNRAVYVIDQQHPGTGKFDEHKVILGAQSRDDALDIYRGGFNDGSAEQRIAGVTETDIDGFRDWLKGGDLAKPAAETFPSGEQQQAGVPADSGSDQSAPAVRPEVLPNQRPDTVSDLSDVPAVHVKQRRWNPGRGIVGFVKANGGLAADPELDAMDLRRSRPGTISNKGRDLDAMREIAAEAGYFNDRYGTTERAVAESTPDDLLRLLREELGGNRAETLDEQLDVDPLGMTDAQSEYEQRARDDATAALDDLAKEYDLAIPTDLRERAIYNLMLDPDQKPDDALERAAIELENEIVYIAQSEGVDIEADTLPGWTDTELDALDETRQNNTPEAIEGPRPGGRGPESQPDDGQGPTEGGREPADAGQTGEQETPEVTDDFDSQFDAAFNDALAKRFVEQGTVESRDYVGMFKALPKDGDKWDELRVDLIERYPDDAAEILDAMETAGGRPDSESEAQERQEREDRKATDNEDARRKGKAIKDFVSQGGAVTLPTPGRRRQARYEDASMIDIREDGPYFQAGKRWNAVTKDQLDFMYQQATAKTETGADGKQQSVIPGAEKASDKDMAQRGSQKRLSAKKDQKPADFGLFGDEKDQTDLLDLAKKTDNEAPGVRTRAGRVQVIENYKPEPGEEILRKERGAYVEAKKNYVTYRRFAEDMDTRLYVEPTTVVFGDRSKINRYAAVVKSAKTPEGKYVGLVDDNTTGTPLTDRAQTFDSFGDMMRKFVADDIPAAIEKARSKDSLNRPSASVLKLAKEQLAVERDLFGAEKEGTLENRDNVPTVEIKPIPTGKPITWEKASETFRNGSDAIDAILADPDAPKDYGVIAERIRDDVANIPINVVRPGDQVPGIVARSMNGLGIAVYYQERAKGQEAIFMRPGADMETVLHELVHGATKEKIDAHDDKKHADTPVGKGILELIDLLKTVNAEYMKRRKEQTFEGGEDRSIRFQAAVTDIHELIAYGMTDPEFQAFLKTIELEKQAPRTAWSKFVATVRSILGIPAAQDNALGEILEVTDKLLAAEMTVKSKIIERRQQMADAKIEEAKPAPSSAKDQGKKRSPRKPKKADTRQAQFARDTIGGDVGDVITLSEGIGYASANKPYLVEGIDNSGTVHIKDVNRESRTTLSRSELMRAKKMGVTFTARPNTVSEVAKDAAKNVGMSLDQASKGLLELFGGGKTIGSGPAFDEETYKKALPYFRAAAFHFAQAGRDVRKIVEILVNHLIDNYGFDLETLKNMEPYIKKYSRDLVTGAERVDVPGSRDDLEPNSPGPDVGDGLGAENVSAGSGPVEPGSGSGRTAPETDGDLFGGSSGVSEDGAADLGTGSDRPASGETSGSRGGNLSDRERQRSDNSGVERPDFEKIGSDRVAKSASDGTDTERRITAQEKINKAPIEIVPGDLDNIRKSLPLLLPPQQEDVKKAEDRFAEIGAKNAYGILFTNGTGTGKTFSGAGIIKRRYDQGQTEQMIVVPTQGIAEDWQRSLSLLGIDAHILESLKDAGKGVSITTYANFGENLTLGKRDFDHITLDESQNLSQNKDGDPTAALNNLRAVTGHPRGYWDRARLQYANEWKEITEKRTRLADITKQTNDLMKDMRGKDRDERAAIKANIDRLAKEIAELNTWLNSDPTQKVMEKTRELARSFNETPPPRITVTFLSATPWAYDKSVDYAEGYLFDYQTLRPGDDLAYNAGDARDRFFMENFGYRMRYNKLTKPEAGVQSEALEREFHEKLKREGALSGRRLELEADYERVFVSVDSGIGTKIDEALKWLSEGGPRYQKLAEHINKQFDYLARMKLLEAIKAKHAVERIKQHHAKGRKVVVFHDFNVGGGINPFAIPPSASEYEYVEYKDGKPDKRVKVDSGTVFQEFLAANPFVMDFDFGEYRSPLNTMTENFPGALFYNGTETKKNRSLAKKRFNDDQDQAANLIVVQSAAGEAGISLHDTTGKNQRVIINLGMPNRPVTAIQEEGRTYRTGQVTDAVFEYMNTGTTWERMAFAHKIAERSGTAENLALGNEARAMRQAFIDGFENTDDYAIGRDGEGKGGKEADRALNVAMSDFDRSKTFYYAQQKKRGKRDQREGTDYYATPEPVGFTMVQMTETKPGMSILEPSAGHGAIARWMPETAKRTLIEPSEELLSRAALAAPGARTIRSTFEQHNAVNKYDSIVMNPPFGSGGALAVKHVAKAFKHLRNGGRLVALLPNGVSSEKKFEEWYENEKEANDAYTVARYNLPNVTFTRAGTSVSTSIVIIDKHKDKEIVAKLGNISRDYSSVTSIEELFNRMEEATIPPRYEPISQDLELSAGEMEVDGRLINVNEDLTAFSLVDRIPPDQFRMLATLAQKHGGDYQVGSGRGRPTTFSFPDPSILKTFLDDLQDNGLRGAPEAVTQTPTSTGGTDQSTYKTAETKHAKTGDDLFVASLIDRVDGDEFKRLAGIAKTFGGWYSRYARDGAIPGFQFKRPEHRQMFIDATTGETDRRVSEALDRSFTSDEQFSIADTIVQTATGSGFTKTPEGWGTIENDPAPRLTDEQMAEAKQIIMDVAALDRVVEAERIVFPANHPGALAWGRTGETEVQGYYSPSADTIGLSRATPDAIGAAYHEAFHRLQSRFLTDQEKALLERENARLVEIMRSEGVRNTEGVSQKELEAEAFAIYARRRRAGNPTGTLHAGVRRIFERFLRMLIRTRNMLMLRGYQDVYSIFEQAYTGQTAQRAERAPRPSEPQTEQFSIFPSGMTPMAQNARRTIASAGRITDAIRVKIQDKALPIRRVQEQVEEQIGQRLPDHLDVYMNEALYQGRTGERLNDLHMFTIQPLLDEMRRRNVDVQEFNDYLYARHAKERNAVVAQRNPKLKNGSGMSDYEAETILRQAGAKQQDFDALSDMVDRMQEDTRNLLVSSGLVGKDEMKAWRDRYENYVPLRGWEATPANEDHPRSGKGFDIRGRESHMALGRRTKADQPLAYIVLQAEQAILRSEKNRVGKTLLRLVRSIPNPGLWEVSRGEVRRRVNPNTGLVESYFVPPAFIRSENLFRVMQGGKPHYIEIKHEGMARAMRNVGYDQQNVLLKWMMGATRIYASMLTQWNPSFIIPNMFRDMETALINVSDVQNKPEGVRRQMITDILQVKTIRGIISALYNPNSSNEYAQWFEEFRQAGGKISLVQLNDVAHIKDNIEASLTRGRGVQHWMSAIKALSAINTAVENGVRLSTYIALRKNGFTQARAAYIARELTVNFNRRGEWSPVINTLYLFFNASIQGSTRMAQAIYRSKIARRAVMGLAVAGITMEYLNAFMSGEDDDGESYYDQIPPWIKERNVIIMIPGSDKYLTIPMAYGYNVPYFMGQQTGAMLRGQRKPAEATGDIVRTAMDSFNPVGSAPSFLQMAAPTFLDPAVQVSENKTFYGGPIYPTKFDPRKPDAENYFDSVPEWAKEIASIMNETTGGSVGRQGLIDVSPEVIEHYMQFISGGLGKFVMNTANTVERGFSGEEFLPEKAPIIRRFYGRGGTSEASVRRFYEAYREVDQAAYEFDRLGKEGNSEGARSAFKEYATEIRFAKSFREARKTLSKVRKQKNAIMKDRKLTADQRKAKVTELEEITKRVISSVMRPYLDAKGK